MSQQELIAEARIWDQQPKRVTPEDLACELTGPRGEHLENPVESPEFREAFFLKVEAVEILCLADLIAADCVLDYMEEHRDSKAYRALQARARAFIERFPQLLEMGWVHVAGAIEDMMESMRSGSTSAGAVLH